MAGLTVDPLRLGLAVVGPSLGIGLWYWIDHGLGRADLALFVGASVIYLVARLGVLASNGDSALRHAAFSLVMVGIAGLCFWVLVGIGAPNLMALAIGLASGTVVHGPIARTLIPVSASVGTQPREPVWGGRDGR